MRRWCLWPCLALVCVAGCSVQMAYDHLDRLARWSLRDYLSLDEPQQAFFDASFDELWRWHRHGHLPAYAALLDDMAARLGDRVTEADLERVTRRIVAWAGEIEARALPPTAKLLASLTPEQVDELAQALERSNRELAEPELGVAPDRAQVRWREQFSDQFTRFSGRLDPAQRAYLEDQATGYRPELVLWADYRRRWQADFLALLADAADAATLQQGLQRLSATREQYYGAALSVVHQHNDALARTVSVWLLGSLSQRQRERFVDRLSELADDFRELASEAG